MNTGLYSSHESYCVSSLQLREFQKKNNLGVPSGAKKKKKSENGSETTTSDGCHSPEEVSLDWPGSWDGRLELSG